ncbi:TetR/AcrR family transcriptional regulator [Microbacterium aerolatum]|uniref:TetR/AcrR family transcriptional regulator n=1 Tax=Microbacterium aerolatum TaxID=153731 RepID=UPI0020008F6B|nr:TetR/AcrR family transcriptional regulator [Microbacterium aerolatum]MCK3768620.1 TetR/AcrR family transcriptional regulator [Microbacterium aerolatum]
MPTPERTSHTAIIEAGREILESDGPAGLTMQAVAARVGVRAPSLYKRIRNRDALLAAVAEATVDDLARRLTAAARLHSAAEMPGNSVDLGRGMQSQGAQWAQGAREELVGLAEAFRAFAHERPEGFRLMFTASAPLDALERAATPVLHAARALVGDDDALDAARLFTAWATGFLQMELAGAFRLGGDVDDAFDYGLDRLIHGLAAG